MDAGSVRQTLLPHQRVVHDHDHLQVLADSGAGMSVAVLRAVPFVWPDTATVASGAGGRLDERYELHLCRLGAGAVELLDASVYFGD